MAKTQDLIQFCPIVCQRINNLARKVQRLDGKMKKALEDRHEADAKLNECSPSETAKWARLNAEYGEADRKHRATRKEHTAAMGDLLETIFHADQQELFPDVNTFLNPEADEVGVDHDPNDEVGPS